MDLSFADTAALAAEGRTFTCAECPEATKAIRKCREDRWDFTTKDGPQFPIYVNKGGSLYGFCPGKATWDPNLVKLFRVLMIAAETGAMLKQGAIEDQPDWFVELLGWFIPAIDSAKFAAKVTMVLGKSDGKKAAPKPDGRSKGGGHSRRPAG